MSPDDRVPSQHAAARMTMSTALADELAEIKRRGVRDVVKVTSGVLVDESSGQWRYRFELKGRCGGLRAGREVGFQAGTMIVPCTIVRRRGAHVVVAFNDSIGKEPGSGHLITDSRWLLVALRRRLREVDSLVRTGSPLFRSTAAARAIGVITPTTQGPTIPCTTPELNHDQRRMVEAGHTSDLLVVWGPAGTGKSYALTHLITTLIDHGERVLYLAPTNLAVDLLLTRAAELFALRTWWRDGAVIRVGPADSISLEAELHERFSLDAVIARHSSGRPLGPAQYRQRAEGIVQSACLTAATVHQSYLSPLLMRGAWDVLVVDEASMVNPIILYTASGLAHRTVVAGDFRQLPPIAHSRSRVARKWLATDPFHTLGVPQEIARGGHSASLVMLREQYRMAEDIAAVVQPAYFHQLVTHPEVRCRPTGPFGPDGLFAMDTHALKARTLVTAGGSRANEVHADLVGDVLAGAIDRGRLGADTMADVLVIAPFVAQVQLLTSKLSERFGVTAPLVRSIHQAQGDEADIVVLDLTDASGIPASRFFRGRDFSSESARLLTVAVTRARQHLIVVADMTHMRRSPGIGIVVRRMIDAISAGRQVDAGRIRRTAA